MIDQEVVSYLNNDATLTALIGASGSDPKIYPVQVRQGASQPYIVYNVPSEGGLEENLKEISMSFDSVADDYITAENIRNRISALLDVQDQINKPISSTAYLYFTSVRVGGAEFKEPDLDLFHRASIFDFKYQILPAITEDTRITEDEEVRITEDGETRIIE